MSISSTPAPGQQIANQKPASRSASKNYRVKDPSPNCLVVIASIVIIAAGAFAFMGVPFLGAAGKIHLSGFLFTATPVAGIVFFVLGFTILARATPQQSISIERQNQIKKDQELLDSKEKNKNLSSKKLIDQLGLITG